MGKLRRATCVRDILSVMVMAYLIKIQVIDIEKNSYLRSFILVGAPDFPHAVYPP